MFHIDSFFFCGVSSSSKLPPAVSSSSFLESICSKFFKFLEFHRVPGILRIPSVNPRVSPQFLELFQSFSLPFGPVKFHKVLRIPRNSSKLKKKEVLRTSSEIPIGSRKQENCP